ncbi:MAG: HAD family hydrolase [Nitrospirae bacterium]|nr:HAD family hydrolase [Nitrospirota bacterium]
MLKAIVFDLDDTLYPERQYALSGFSAVADWAESTLGISRERGYSELVAYFEDGVRGDTFNRWLEAHDLEPGRWIPDMVTIYRDHTPSLEPYPETHSVLRSLRGSYRLGLITQGHKPGQQRKLEALGLAETFEAVLILGEQDRQDWKPSQVPFERLLEELDLAGSQAAHVGDNPLKDFVGARQLGMLTIWVRRPEGEHDGLSAQQSTTFEAPTGSTGRESGL